MIFSPQTAYAAEDSSQHETVKVGFFAMDGYHMMDEEGNRSGYGSDFLLQKHKPDRLKKGCKCTI